MDEATTTHQLLAARQLLAKALHFHRFFGKPIAAFSEEHNAFRAQDNRRVVAAYAAEAGQRMAWSRTADTTPLGEVGRAALEVVDIATSFWPAMVVAQMEAAS